MKCSICKGNLDFSRDEKIEFENLGFYTPGWLVKDICIDPEKIEAFGFKINDFNSPICFDCQHAIRDACIEKSKFFESESNTSKLKWFRSGSDYYGDVLDLQEIDDHLDKIIKEHNNHFDVKDDLWFEVKYWDTYNGDNVSISTRFNRDFNKESGYSEVEDLLNNSILDEYFGKASVNGTGWDKVTKTPAWSFTWNIYSDYNKDHSLKRPNATDAYSLTISRNGTEPFTKKEGEEISQVVCDKIAEAIEKIIKDPRKTRILRSRPGEPDFAGSYTHNFGHFNMNITIKDISIQNLDDEGVLTKLLKEVSADALNSYLYDYNLVVRPESCEATWYENDDNDSYTTSFEVRIGFKEADIENPYNYYYSHKGNSFPNKESVEDFSKRFKKLKESGLTYPEMLDMFKDLKSGSIYNFVCNNYTTKVNLRQEEFDATDIFNSDKVQNACIKASQLILIKTKHTTNEKIQIYIRMLPYYILKFRDILSTKQFEDLCTKRIKLLCNSDNFYQFYYLLTEIDPVAFDENFEQKITDIVEDYIFIHPSKIYNDFRYSCCENGNFSDETISKNIRYTIETFLDNNEDAIVENAKKVVKVAFDTFSNIVDEFEKVGRAKEDAAIAQYQKYIDWIENGNPVYYIYGWSYKGAKLKRISINEALKQLEKEKPFEYNWENINGEKALVLQYVGENDLY